MKIFCVFFFSPIMIFLKRKIMLIGVAEWGAQSAEKCARSANHPPFSRTTFLL